MNKTVFTLTNAYGRLEKYNLQELKVAAGNYRRIKQYVDEEKQRREEEAEYQKSLKKASETFVQNGEESFNYMNLFEDSDDKKTRKLDPEAELSRDAQQKTEIEDP